MATKAKAKFFMQKTGGKLEFCGQQQKRLYAAYVEGLDGGQVIEASFQKRRHAKTSAQLGYWYGVLMPFCCDELRAAGHDELFAVAVGSLSTGVATTPDTTDLLFKTLFAAHKQLDKAPLKRAMTDEQMGELIDFTMEWTAKNLGAVAPQPEK